MYGAWSAHLPSDIEVLALQLPGHEGRYDEDLPTRLTELANHIRPTLGGLLDRPFAFFGHSFGAVLAFEVTRSLRRAGLRLPERLMVAASRPPDRLPQEPLVEDLSDGDLIAILRSLSAAPLMFDDPELTSFLVPTLRADLAMLQAYHPRPEAPLGIPITAYAGADDPSVRPEHMAGWKSFTKEAHSLVTLPGGHFFIRNIGQLLPLIGTELSSVATGTDVTWAGIAVGEGPAVEPKFLGGSLGGYRRVREG